MVGVLRSLSVTAKKRKRGYSKEFRAHGESGKRYLIDGIPAGFWADVRKQIKEDGLSIRGLILGLLREWLEKRQREQTDKANRWPGTTSK
jgi:hypothetical protein